VPAEIPPEEAPVEEPWWMEAVDWDADAEATEEGAATPLPAAAGPSDRNASPRERFDSAPRTAAAAPATTTDRSAPKPDPPPKSVTLTAPSTPPTGPPALDVPGDSGPPRHPEPRSTQQPDRDSARERSTPRAADPRAASVRSTVVVRIEAPIAKSTPDDRRTHVATGASPPGASASRPAVPPVHVEIDRMAGAALREQRPVAVSIPDASDREPMGITPAARQRRAEPTALPALPPAKPPQQIVQIDRVTVTVETPAPAPASSPTPHAAPATSRTAPPRDFRNPWASYHGRRD
jgi:hypothetical protein